MTVDLSSDPRADTILDLIAAQIKVDRSLLTPDARADQLGLSSLDLALAMFEIEDRFDIDLPEMAPGARVPTVGELVEQVLQTIDRKEQTSRVA